MSGTPAIQPKPGPSNLSYPPASNTASHPASSSSSSLGKPDRLYVGNLSPAVDEYTLIQIFQKYGKITKLDFMFHKSGALKGKPRGYAFIEFNNKDDALKAMVKLHDRLLRGRKLVVTYANSAPLTDLPPLTKGRRPTEAPKTTTLSLLKKNRRPLSATAQIAAMEAKLNAMAQRKPADEDYVPGQGAYRTEGESGTASPSHSPSPAPEMDLAEEMGLGPEAGGKAAEDLEREMGEELGFVIDTKPDIVDDKMGQGGVKEEVPTIPTLPSNPALPARPAMAIAAPTESRSMTKGEVFKKGLAGLPKKPVF